MKQAPYTLNQRITTCENSCFKIYFDHLVDGNSSLVEDYLVVEPKNRNIDAVTGVAILPINNEKFGLINVYRHPIGEYSWEIPRGFIDKDESSAEAAIRELREETGLICDKRELKELGTIAPEPGIISAKVNIYMADVTKVELHEKENELGHVDFNWFTHNEIKRLMHEQLMRDATTLITYFKAIYC